MSEIQAYPVQIQRHVKWGEMDAFQHVNNTVYLRYFEDVRIEHFQQLGVLELMESEGLGPILAETSCRFRLPLQYPDEVVIGSRIGEVGEDRFVMEYAVHSLRHNRLAASGHGLIVYFDYAQGSKTAIPPQIAAQLAGGT